MLRIRLAAASAVAALLLFWPTAVAAQVQAQQPTARIAAATLAIPSSVEASHRAVQSRLAAITNAGGRTGAAAVELERVLGPHLRKEEQLALPLLGLLPGLAQGAAPADLAGAVALADRLRAEMPAMLREHQDIAAAIVTLRRAAQEDGNTDAAAFADQLAAHAAEEEQILYPGALLVGAYLRTRR